MQRFGSPNNAGNIRNIQNIHHDDNDDNNNIPEAFVKSAEHLLGRDELRAYQVRVLYHLLSTKNPRVTAIIKMGGGKSDIIYGFPALARGVSIAVMPTRSLQADQYAKAKNRALNGSRPVECHNVDTMTAEEINYMIDHLRKLKSVAGTPRRPPILLFISPQKLAIVNEHDGIDLSAIFIELAKDKVVNGVFLDEIDLMVEQGETFRPEFALVGKRFVKPLLALDNKDMQLAIVILTATFTEPYFARTEKMFGLGRDTMTMVEWAHPIEMMRKGVTIELVIRQQVKRSINSGLRELAAHPGKPKGLVLSSSRKGLPKVRDKIEKAVQDVLGIETPIYVVELHGKQADDVKEANTAMFTGEVDVSQKDYSDNVQFANATQEMATVGLSCGKLTRVFNIGGVRSLSALTQQVGRMDRGMESTMDPPFKYTVIINTENFAYLYRSSAEKERGKDVKIADLMEVLRFMCLSVQCWHWRIDKTFGRPGVLYAEYRCEDRCPFCSGTYSEIALKIDKKVLQKVLWNLFVAPTPKRIEFGKPIVSVLRKHEEVVFGKKVEAYHVEFLALKLVATGVLQLALQESTTVVFLPLSGIPNGTHPYIDESKWNLFEELDPLSKKRSRGRPSLQSRKRTTLAPITNQTE